MSRQAGQVFVLQLVLLATVLAMGAAAVSAAVRLHSEARLATLSAAAQGLAQQGLAEAVDALAQGNWVNRTVRLPWKVPPSAALVASVARAQGQGGCSGADRCPVWVAVCASEYGGPASASHPVSFEILVGLRQGASQQGGSAKGEQQSDGSAWGAGTTVISFTEWHVPLPDPSADSWCSSGATLGTAP